jgi:hypothetical protein
VNGGGGMMHEVFCAKANSAMDGPNEFKALSWAEA